MTTVADAELRPTSSPAPMTGLATIDGRVTLRIDKVLWSRASALSAPRTFTALCGGWIAKDYRPFVADGTPWVVVGLRHILPIAL